LLNPKDQNAQNQLAWLLATCPESDCRNAHRAVELAQELADRFPDRSLHWATLGVAHYGTGDYPAAIQALTKATQLPGGPNVFFPRSVGFFLAMSHWQLGDKEEARRWYDQAVAATAIRPGLAEQRLRRAQAEKLLGIATGQKPE
jgi:Flp pilus assembly protein TadD